MTGLLARRRVGYLTVLGLLLAANLAQAQGHRSEGTRRKPVPIDRSDSRDAVATHPSNSPFSDPLAQPLPPAVSVNPPRNSNRTNVPLQTPRSR